MELGSGCDPGHDPIRYDSDELTRAKKSGKVGELTMGPYFPYSDHDAVTKLRWASTSTRKKKSCEEGRNQERTRGGCMVGEAGCMVCKDGCSQERASVT